MNPRLIAWLCSDLKNGMRTLSRLYHDLVSNLVKLSGRCDHGLSGCHRSLNASLAMGLHGAGVPDRNLHSRLGHGRSLNWPSMNRVAFCPLPEHVGTLLGCCWCPGSC